MKSNDALIWLKTIPISLVYARFLAHADKMQAGLNVASQSIRGAVTTSFEFPIPNQEEFTRIWERIASTDLLAHFWQKQLRLSDLKPVLPIVESAKVGGFVDAHEEAA